MKKLKLEELGRISVEDFKEAEKIPVCILLDNVRSLHNVGSAFRTADAFRIEKIYLTGITGTPPHREIQKTALGATESVAWEYAESPAEIIQNLKPKAILISQNLNLGLFKKLYYLKIKVLIAKVLLFLKFFMFRIAT